MINILARETTSFNLQPTTTVGELKKFLNDNNYEVSSTILTFTNGQQLAPIVFQTNQYDGVNFQQYANYLKGSSLVVTKIAKKQIQTPELPPLSQIRKVGTPSHPVVEIPQPRQIEYRPYQEPTARNDKYYSVAVTGYTYRLLDMDDIRSSLDDIGLEMVEVLFIADDTYPVSKIYQGYYDNLGIVRFTQIERLPRGLEIALQGIQDRSDAGFIVFGNSENNGGLSVELSTGTVREAVDALDYMHNHGIENTARNSINFNGVDVTVNVIEFDTESG